MRKMLVAHLFLAFATTMVGCAGDRGLQYAPIDGVYRAEGSPLSIQIHSTAGRLELLASRFSPEKSARLSEYAGSLRAFNRVLSNNTAADTAAAAMRKGEVDLYLAGVASNLPQLQEEIERLASISKHRESDQHGYPEAYNLATSAVIDDVGAALQTLVLESASSYPFGREGARRIESVASSIKLK